MRLLLYSLFATLLFSACQSDPTTVVPAFYHWKSTYSPEKKATETLDQLGVQRMYVRYFDLKYHAEKSVYPEARLSFSPTTTFPQEIVPTIYITNRSILQTPLEDIDSLAHKTLHLLLKLHAEGPATPLKEVQFDCDWTSRSKDRYFRFLRTCREQLASEKIAISATVRLHQLKFRDKTGIPPVDRGMLMFYNMGKVDDPAESNSILRLETGRAYLENYRPYPLPLDLALPIFSWGVLHRQGRPIRLLNNTFPEEFAGVPDFEKIDSNRVKVRKSRYFKGQFLYQGDEIRVESVSRSALLEAAELLAATIETDTTHIALYHLDALTLKHYELETLAAVFDAFRR